MVSGMGQDTTSNVRGGVQDADEYIDQHHTGRERDQGSGSRVSVYEAADLLGVTWTLSGSVYNGAQSPTRGTRMAESMC